MILLLECQAITIRSRIFNWVKILLRISAAAAASLQSCPTLCDSIDGSPPGSPVPGILQARTLEWVAISFSNAWKWKVKVKSFSRVRLLATPWTAAYQAPPSIDFPGKSRLPLPSPKNYHWASIIQNFMEALYILDFRCPFYMSWLV